jgi:hypothetical protein
MCCHCINRRQFLGTTAALAAGAMLAAPGAAAEAWGADFWEPSRFAASRKPLRVQPILMYRLPERREMASWKSWGGVQTEAALAEEEARINKELIDLAARADFPMEPLPAVRVKDAGAAAAVHAANPDAAVIVYPCTGSGTLLNACLPASGGVIFVRHKSGPVYYWYEALSTQLLNNDKAPADPAKRASVHDVVVDDPDELLWRLRVLAAVRNFMGAKIVALGGPAGKYAGEAPAFAREKFKLDIVDCPYQDFEPRLQAALADPAKMKLAEQWTDRYLAIPGTTLDTERRFVVGAFVLYGLFKEIMQEADTPFFTIKECMSTVIPMSKTTACLTLGLLNDEGYAAFCESDFVIVPAGMFLWCLTGRPVFMHNSTFPHGGIVTCAHCSAPRRMNGERYEPCRIVTHYESEFGASPKVDIPPGQEVTFIDPEYATGRWVGIKGTVESNPFYEICRSQQDVKIHGNWKKLLNEVRDSHWMMVYGDHLQEIGYAAPRIGITWDNISEA